MPNQSLTFLNILRQDPISYPIDERLKNWNEIYYPLSEAELKDQARRCMDCGISFCQSSFGCPLENQIPKWNELVAKGKWEEAFHALHETNNFPEFTGRLCPAPCESACVLGLHSEAVSIRNIELNIIERGFNEGWVNKNRIKKKNKTFKKVALIGSGPSGLAAASELIQLGHEVIVFEKSSLPGGLLRYGIPNFKMEKNILDRRINQLEEDGVKFKTNTLIGRDILMDDLLKEFDAVGLLLGAEEPRDLLIPGRNLSGIHFAMEYLSRQNENSANKIDAKGKKVVVIGGGDTGSDCLGTAHRQGCISAHQLELLEKPPVKRSPLTPWPTYPQVLKTTHAHEEGGEREWSISTQEFLGENNQLKALKTSKVRFENNKMITIPNTEKIIEADLVFLAMGFLGAKKSGLINQLLNDHAIKLDTRGNIEVNGHFQTSTAKIFAAGDVKRGASLIVWAIAEGRKMASSINRFLI